METRGADSGAPTLKRSGRQWRCEVGGKHAGDGAAKAKLARTACGEHPATTLGAQARPQCVTS